MWNRNVNGFAQPKPLTSLHEKHNSFRQMLISNVPHYPYWCPLSLQFLIFSLHYANTLLFPNRLIYLQIWKWNIKFHYTVEIFSPQSLHYQVWINTQCLCMYGSTMKLYQILRERWQPNLVSLPHILCLRLLMPDASPSPGKINVNTTLHYWCI